MGIQRAFPELFADIAPHLVRVIEHAAARFSGLQRITVEISDRLELEQGADIVRGLLPADLMDSEPELLQFKAKHEFCCTPLVLCSLCYVPLLTRVSLECDARAGILHSSRRRGERTKGQARCTCQSSVHYVRVPKAPVPAFHRAFAFRGLAIITANRDPKWAVLYTYSVQNISAMDLSRVFSAPPVPVSTLLRRVPA